MIITIETSLEYTPKAIKMLKDEIREYFWSKHKLSNLHVDISVLVKICENCDYFQENLVCEGGMCDLLSIDIRHSAILSCEKHRKIEGG